MYIGARIVSFILTVIACLLLLAAVLVWFVQPPAQLDWNAIHSGVGSGTGQPDPDAAKAAQDAQVGLILVHAGMSAVFVLAALVILLFCDLVRAVVNTARDTRAMLGILSRNQQALAEGGSRPYSR